VTGIVADDDTYWWGRLAAQVGLEMGGHGVGRLDDNGTVHAVGACGHGAAQPSSSELQTLGEPVIQVGTGIRIVLGSFQ